MNSVKIGGFKPESLYAKAVIPILDALNWSGSNRGLIESLVDNANYMDRSGLIQTLSNLKYQSYVNKAEIPWNGSDEYPIAYGGRNFLYVVIAKRNSGYLVFDCKSSEYKSIKELPKGKFSITFTELDSGETTLLEPQRNWFFMLLARFKKEFFHILAISILITIFSFVTPLFIMLINSQIRIAQDWSNIADLGIISLVFILAVAGFKYLRSYQLNYLSTRIGNIVSKEIYRRLIYLPPKLIDTASVRSQLTRIKDFESITDFFSGSAFTSLIDIPLSLLMIIGLAFIGGNIVFVPLTAYILMIAVGYFAYSSFKKVNSKDLGSLSEKNQVQNEMLSKMIDIRITGNKKRWFNKFRKYYRESIIRSAKSSNFLITVNSISKAMVNITLILSIALSVLKVIRGESDSAVLFTSFIIISRIMAPLRNGYSTLSQLSRLKKSIDQLNKFMGLQIESSQASISPIHNNLNGVLQFNNLFLKYGKEIHPALINIKFKQDKNETTIITGHGGCGKSSFVKVLLGLYTPISGSITIDNINIMQLDKIELRKYISYLPAEPYLFPGDLKFNLYLGKTDATDTQLLSVLEKVGIKDEILSLEDGLDTDISNLPEEMRLPGFIKRLNMAIMLLRNSSLYIIDSIENGLEPEDYPLFSSVISELKGKATIFITTSKPEFLKLGHNIMTMDSGRIVEIKKNDNGENDEEKL